MASMELTPEQSEEEGKAINDYKPRYAVGELWLDDKAMEALGVGPLAPGTVLKISASAKVVSVSARDDNASGKPEGSMSVQITDMDLAPAEKAVDAKALYPNSKME